MATSLSNFFSFLFFPSKTPPPPKLAPPNQISANPPSSSQSQFQSQTLKSRDVSVPTLIQDGHSSSDLSSVICPSLAYSNTLFFSSPYNVQLVVDDDEPEESVLSRFRRDVMRAGIVQECRRRMFHEDKHEKKKRKAREAAKRNRRRTPYSRFPEKDEGTTTEDIDEDDDNWDVVGDTPY